MVSKKNHILFVSHVASRSGAPILLLEIIKAFREQTNIPFYILSMESGELINDFNKLGKTFVWKKKPLVSKNRFISKCYSLLNRALQVAHGTFIINRIKDTNLVFYNTIVNEHIQKKLSFLKCSSVCYVHEMEAAMHMLTSPAGRAFIFNNTGLFLSVSGAVKNNLVNNCNVDSSIVKVIATPASETFRNKKDYLDFDRQFKNEHKTGDAVLIGIVGTNEWRKGFDLLVPLVTLYFQHFPSANVYFIWKGFRKDQHNSFFDLYDYERSVYRNRILLLPHDEHSIAQMASFDIHLLLSREDPYPLVVLETASFGIPTVCFAEAGGTPEFVEDNCGFIIPYADLNEMAKKLNMLVTNVTLRNEMGLNCREKLVKRHEKKAALKNIIDIILNKAAVLN